MHEHLRKAICRLLIKEPFYGIILSQMEVKEDRRVDTMAVCMNRTGHIDMLYNVGFIEKLKLEELYGVLVHEVGHVINLHIVRRHKNMEAFHLGCEMAVNGHEKNPRIAYQSASRVVVPPGAIYIPPDWPDNLTAEEYTEKLPKCPKCGMPMLDKIDQPKGQSNQSKGDKSKSKNQPGDQPKDQPNGQSGGQSDGQSGDQSSACPHCGTHKTTVVTLDNHGVWKETEISEDEARQIVKQMVDEAIAHSPPGSIPGHLTEAIEELNKPIINYRQILRRFLRRNAGGIRHTYSRPNRRFNELWMKGISHRATATFGAIIDTSGSITHDDLRQFFAEIEAIASKAKIWVMQYDCDFQGLNLKYRKGDWKNIEIKGRGGTDMGKALDYVVENKLPADAILVLTDGNTPWRTEPMPVPTLIALVEERNAESCPKWAEVVPLRKM